MSEPLSEDQLRDYAAYGRTRNDTNFDVTLAIRALLGEVERLKAENSRLKQERGRLFSWVIDSEQMEKSRPNENYYLPKSEAIAHAISIIREGDDVSIEERDALAKHDEEHS